ncbi:general substrate transporter [Penicillium herquei]|nr:general substrate transporter [Penicillium herquei]
MEKKDGENEHWEEGQTSTGEIDNNEIHGRAIQQQEHNRGYWETLNNDPWLLFWIGMMLWTLIIRGFENQSAGSVISIAEFKRRFGQQESDGTYFIATPWQSALSGGGNAAAILGAWGSSYLADIFGTKPVLIAGCAINIASVGVEFATTSIGMFFGGKMMNFVAIGVFLNLCTAYVSDISPLAIRASVIGFCNLSQCIGPFISAIMSYYTSQWDNDWSWKALICAQWGFAIIGFVGQLFMPESPVYLVRVNKEEKARKVLNRLYSKPADAEGHLQRIKLTLEEAETQKRATYAECFRGTNLRRTMIAVLVFLAEPMSGLGFVQNYGSLMYQFLGIGDRQSFLIQIGAQILSISGATFSFLIGDFYGRRPMFLGGCISLTLLLLCMGIAGSVNTTAGITAAVGFYTMYNFVFNIGVGSNVYAIAGEVPTSALRTKTLAISLIVSNAVNTMWSFVAPYMFNPGYGDLKAKIGFVFGGFMLFFIAGAWYLVPETRMRTYEELDELFMNRVPTREFKKYVTVAERRAAEAYATERKLSAPEVEREEV